MHSHSAKISVLRSMMGLHDEKDIIVPQNSVSTIRHAMTSEHGAGKHPGIAPPESTSRSHPNLKCPHCENMAKNFLYLESLIRTNYDSASQCSLCYSALKYLQYVNKSIMQVFGNFDSIAEAARAFAHPNKRARAAVPARKVKRKSKLSESTHSTSTAKQSKSKLKKNPSTAKTTGGNKPASRAKLDTRKAKRPKSTPKGTHKLKNKTALLSSHSVRTAEGAFENGSKVIKGKKNATTRKNKTGAPQRGTKAKGTKGKRNNN